jgi:transposase
MAEKDATDLPDPKEVARLRGENERLRKENEHLRDELKKKDAQIEELQRSLKRQAAPFSKGVPKPNPKPPGRKPGPAYGRKGHREAPRHVDEVHDVPLPARCPHCGCSALYHDHVESQFQVEIPRKPITRRFNIAFGHCSDCGRRVHGRHPLQTSDAVGAAASQLGSDAQAALVHLNKEGGLSHGKIAHFFQAFFGISLTRGGSAQIMLRAAQRCGPVYREICVLVRRSDYIVPDETGWKVGGLLHWLHAFVTRCLTAYLIRKSRGADVAQELLGPGYAGALTHDGWAPYDSFWDALHQLCLAHPLRRCEALLKTATRGAVRFPRDVKALLLHALALRDRRDAGTISAQGLSVATGLLEARLQRLLTWPRAHPANERFAKHLFNHAHQLFTFLRVPGLDATNWRAEQALRPAVVNRKVWGGNRTPRGAQAQACLMSVLRTCAQQRLDSLAFLSHTLRSAPGQPLPLTAQLDPG